MVHGPFAVQLETAKTPSPTTWPHACALKARGVVHRCAVRMVMGSGPPKDVRTYLLGRGLVKRLAPPAFPPRPQAGSGPVKPNR